MKGSKGNCNAITVFLRGKCSLSGLSLVQLVPHLKARNTQHLIRPPLFLGGAQKKVCSLLAS